jgi:segregation and condensation protein A
LLAGVTPGGLREAWERAVTPRPLPRVDLDHVAPIRVSVAEVVDELAVALPGAGWRSFRDLTAGLPTRLDVIVRFLALLELFKQGLVDLAQAKSFGELTVAWTGAGGAADRPAGLAHVDSYDG